jgi:hypothetical protein
MPELTDDDFRRRPDPAKQLRLAAAGKIARGPGTIRHDAEHGRILCGPVAAIGKPLIEVFAEEARTEKPKGRDLMNATEQAYDELLEGKRLSGEIVWHGFGCIRVRLADGAWYKPDFVVIPAYGKIEFHEVKGYWREASRVRIKVAADRYQWARFVAVRKKRKRDGGGWQVEEF